VAEVFPQLALMTEEPDPELYNFHRASSRAAEDLGQEDFQAVLSKLPLDLAARVRDQGLDTLKQLLADAAGGPPDLSQLPPEVMAALPPQLAGLPPARWPPALVARLQESLQAARRAALPPAVRAAVGEVLAAGAAQDGELAARWEERQAGVRLLQVKPSSCTPALTPSCRRCASCWRACC
jgi:hypothetical protein